jgi:cobalamin biosynthesis protein CobT
VFRQREDVRAVNAAVFLLVDASGSMSGSTYAQAAASAVMLADALSACKAMVRVETFTEEPHRLVHGLIKNWDERYNKDRMIHRLGKQSDHLLNNSDGESVLWSYHQLRNVRADKKLLLVISDGAPAGDGPGKRGVSGFTREALKLVEADKSIRTIGLGINGHDASEWYKQCVNVRNMAELPAALLQIAKAVYE